MRCQGFKGVSVIRATTAKYYSMQLGGAWSLHSWFMNNSSAFVDELGGEDGGDDVDRGLIVYTIH